MAIVSGKHPPASALYPAQRRDGALLPAIECSTRHWHDPFARAKTYSLNPLRIDITKEKGALSDNHPRRKNKVVLLDIIIVNP